MTRATELDHLVLAVPDLAAGVADLAARTGAVAVPGGAHRGLGTHNALLGLEWRGERRCYLELIAPDPQQPEVSREAMMLDLGALGADFAPRLHAWAARPADLRETLAAAAASGFDAGTAVAASRTTTTGQQLSWRLAVPRPLGLGGVQPFLIDWEGGHHPSDDAMPTLELVALELVHPHPAAANERLRLLGVDQTVIAGPEPALRATLAGPTGVVDLT